MSRSDIKARPPGKGAGLTDSEPGGRFVDSTVTPRSGRRTARAVAALPARDRERLLDRLAELSAIDRTMRERGTLAGVGA